jgi:hypothetical protein
MRVGPCARLALATFALAACGGGATPPTPDADAEASEVSDAGSDAGDATSDARDVGAKVTSAFTVTATLSLTPAAGGSWGIFPRTHIFTAFVDAQALGFVAGAFGRNTAVDLSASGAGAFKTKSGLSLPTLLRGPCDAMDVSYDELSFSIAGGRLTGTGRGKAFLCMGDLCSIAEVTATLAGAPDVDPPTVLPPSDTIEPMGEALFVASEPLAESAASLIGADGDVFALGAQISDGPPRFTTGFVRSPLMLNWGTTYEITTEALTDFAGNMGVRAARPKVSTPPAPPFAAEDGFEAVEGPAFGGAGVVAAGPLASTKSLAIVAGFSSPVFFPNAGSSVTLRLAVESGDTMVRFAARLATTYELSLGAFRGQARVGVPGREVNVAAIPRPTNTVTVNVPNGGTYYLGPMTTIEVPLPLGTNPEVSFQVVAATTPHCGAPLPPVALVIDDLRVE